MKKFKHLLFKVCPKTGKIRGFNKNFILYKLLFPLFGLISLIWVLIRVIPKPSRATYPCQEVAIPAASAFLSYIAAIFLSVTTFKGAQHFLRSRKFLIFSMVIVFGVVLSLLFYINAGENSLAADTGTFTPSDAANSPMGTARGIMPGRVAWAYDLSACTWDGTSNYWWSNKFNDQTKITAILDKVVCSVANQGTVSASWDALFKNHNGGAGYVKGEKIIVKINLNNNGASNEIDASPQSVYALLTELVNDYGVNQADITVCDPAREGQGSAVTNYCKGNFPNVNFNANLGGWTTCLQLSNSAAVEHSLSTALYNAKYLITLALLKRHCTPSATWGTDGVDYGNASVTMIFKSSWGLVGNNRAQMHNLLHDWAYPMASYHVLTDIYASKHINGKTVLNILDGLYTGDRWNSTPRKWNMAPFNGHYPCSFFASQDPVALESVGLDFLRSEMPLIKNADRHLHEAAQANNPPSGSSYEPDGVKVGSLGVHEHWNNSTSKQYSRNLNASTGKGIELLNVSGTCSSTPINPYIQVNGGTWQNVSSVTVNSGDAIIIGPQPITGGSWSWTGCGASGTARQQTITAASTCTSIATYTNTCGAKSTQNFTITVNGSTTGIVSGGTYTITAKNSGKVLDVVGNSTADGAVVQQYTGNGATNQQWVVTNNGSNYTVASVKSGKVLDVTGNSLVNGAIIEQWTGNGGTNQQWVLTPDGSGYYQVQSVRSGLCLDVPGSTALDTALQQYTCNGGNNQKFSFTQLKSAPVIAAATIPQSNTMSVSPNPVNGSSAQLTIGLEAKSEVNIAVINYVGNVVYQQNLGVREAGVVSETLDLSSVAKGTYIIKVQTKNGTKTTKLVRL
jgi:hypothetical protein